MDSPIWFRNALDMPGLDRHIEVAGARIHYLEWGAPSRPGLVFVHGGAAHAHWWSFLAPMFAANWHVIAPDMSGHGDSDHRDIYSHELWTQELLALIEEAEFPGPPVIVGHSLGGLMTIHTAARYSDRLAGAVIVDSPVRRPDPESEEGTRGRAFRSPGTYPDLDTALGHFRLVPSQPCDNDFVLDYVGRRSLRETDAGWTWKFDPSLFSHALVSMREELKKVTCRVALLRGEHSVVVPDDVAQYMYELMGRAAPVVSIPEAHHHLILDQPLAFVASLRTLLADWNHSVPHRRADAPTPSDGSP